MRATRPVKSAIYTVIAAGALSLASVGMAAAASSDSTSSDHGMQPKKNAKSVDSGQSANQMIRPEHHTPTSGGMTSDHGMAPKTNNRSIDSGQPSNNKMNPNGAMSGGQGGPKNKSMDVNKGSTRSGAMNSDHGMTPKNDARSVDSGGK